MIRKLRADEIDCRVATINEKGCSLLLYKDARVDMNILDETFGSMNWQRRHESIDGKMFCTISVWDEDKKQWVSKQDVGVESYTEATKGESSDSFKRAAFCWQIGRELYTAPFIWIPASCVNIKEKNGKKTTYDRFIVRSIGYDGDKISQLEIYNTSMNKVVWSMGTLESATPAVEKKPEKVVANYVPTEEDKNKKATQGQVDQITALCMQKGVPESYIFGLYKKKSLKDLTRVQAYSVVNSFDQFVTRYKADEPPFK